MVHSESEKHKSELFDIFRKKFEGRLEQTDLDFISCAFNRYIHEMVKLMKDGKSAHEKFFSDIIINSIDAIIGFDNDSKVFLWNKGAETLFGWKKEEIQGRDFGILIPRKLLINGEKQYMLNEIKTKGYFANYETERITKSGDLKNVSISRFVIYDDKGTSIGNVGIVRDITKEKQLEKELREKENLALIGQVVSSIAHNLSNPLNIISGNADYLL
ncbi:MAG: PAS domain S-box protein, partial [Ignavibacteriae bacterium]|nr:PAS domain S-box protein [Ignavibacteriota bacterium]